MICLHILTLTLTPLIFFYLLLFLLAALICIFSRTRTAVQLLQFWRSRERVVTTRKLCSSATLERLYTPLPIKSSQQQHLNPSTSKHSQLIATNAPKGTNAISRSYLHPNTWLSTLSIHAHAHFYGTTPLHLQQKQ